jgi:hypothetical protein
LICLALMLGMLRLLISLPVMSIVLKYW